ELPAGGDRRRALAVRAEQLGRHGERLARRVGARQVNPPDAQCGGALPESVAGDQRRVVAGVELVLRKVEERDTAVAELVEVREALLDRGAEVEIDEADAARVRRSADDRERAAARLQTLDPAVVRECLHEDDAVRPAGLDETDDAVWICGRRGEEERVVARARLLGRAGDEGLLDGNELPLRRRKEERDRVRGAG